MNFDILVPITVAVSLFGIAYLIVSARHRERMSMIEKGTSYNSLENKEIRRAKALKIALLLLGFGIGLLMGHLVNTVFTSVKHPVFYFAFMFLFGGLGLLFYYKVEKINSIKCRAIAE